MSLGIEYGDLHLNWWNRDSFYLIYAKGAGPSLDDGMDSGSQGIRCTHCGGYTITPCTVVDRTN